VFFDIVSDVFFVLLLCNNGDEITEKHFCRKSNMCIIGIYNGNGNKENELSIIVQPNNNFCQQNTCGICLFQLF
jgi:hypothetical protein